MTKTANSNQTKSPIRLGYFVPEFPGQTHIFFWREIEKLESLGVEVRILSSRLPPENLRSHSWSELAKARTTYLFTQWTLSAVFVLLSSAFSFGPRAWGRVLASIRRSGLTLGERMSLIGLAFFGAKLALHARRDAWTHLHSHSAANASNVALYAHLLSGLPYSLTLHGPLIDYGANQKEKWSNAAFGIVITQKLFGELRAELGEAATKNLLIAPMGVNLSIFQRSAAYQVWDQSSPAKLYAVGRLNICKGHDYLIRAVGILRDRGVSIQLQIAGEDEFGGTGYHQELAGLISELKLNREIKLLGAVSEQVIREGLSSSHVFTLASLQEPLGVAIMEAMALEMPVVVTGAGGVKELVDDGQNGLLVEPMDSLGLADAIERVLKDHELATRLAQASRQKIKTAFQDIRSAEILVASLEKYSR